MMRKDFELIARLIGGSLDFPTHKSKIAFAHSAASVLAETNPRFDRDRFLKACGVI